MTYQHISTSFECSVVLADQGFPFLSVVLIFPHKGIQLSVPHVKHEHDAYED